MMFNSSRPRGRRSAFTLVEILIVVVILGILAAIVLPQFANARGNSADNALKDNLRWMRSAILLYQAEHGTFPTLANFQGQMTQYSDMAGNVSASKDATHRFGAYFLALPPLPIGNERGQTAVTGPSYTTGFGWQYDESDGTLHANVQASEVDGDGKAYSTY
jgi:general secretion pathway protein G